MKTVEYLKLIEPYVKAEDWEQVISISSNCRANGSTSSLTKVIKRVIEELLNCVDLPTLAGKDVDPLAFTRISIPRGDYTFKDARIPVNAFMRSNFNGSNLTFDNCYLTTNTGSTSTSLGGMNNVGSIEIINSNSYLYDVNCSGMVDLYSASFFYRPKIYRVSAKEMYAPKVDTIYINEFILGDVNDLYLPDNLSTIHDFGIITALPNNTINSVHLGPNITSLGPHSILADKVYYPKDSTTAKTIKRLIRNSKSTDVNEYIEV